MIDGSAVLTVFLVYLAGVVIPGPNFVAVVHKAVAAIALSQPKIARAYQRRKKVIDRLCGGLMLALGMRQLS